LGPRTGATSSTEEWANTVHDLTGGEDYGEEEEDRNEEDSPPEKGD